MAVTAKGAYRRAPAEKRQAIVAAARELFVDQGFEKTSTAQIAALAGVSEGILFHHFGSKRALFDGVANDFIEAAVAATLPTDPSQLTEEGVVRAAFDFADANPGLYTFLLQANSELGEPVDNSGSDELVRAIENKLSQAMAEGLTKPGNARIIAELQFAVVDGAYKAWRRSGQPELRENYIVEAICCMQAYWRSKHLSG